MFQHTMQGTLDSENSIQCDRLRDQLESAEGDWVVIDVPTLDGHTVS